MHTDLTTLLLSSVLVSSATMISIKTKNISYQSIMQSNNNNK